MSITVAQLEVFHLGCATQRPIESNWSKNHGNRDNNWPTPEFADTRAINGTHQTRLVPRTGQLMSRWRHSNNRKSAQIGYHLVCVVKLVVHIFFSFRKRPKKFAFCSQQSNNGSFRLITGKQFYDFLQSVCELSGVLSCLCLGSHQINCHSNGSHVWHVQGKCGSYSRLYECVGNIDAVRST